MKEFDMHEKVKKMLPIAISELEYMIDSDEISDGNKLKAISLIIEIAKPEQQTQPVHLTVEYV